MILRVTVFLIFSIISFPVFSEIYSCTHTLERYNRPGEIETTIFQRKGSYFRDDNGREREIIYESLTYLILSNINNIPNDPSVNVIFINKETKEWGWNFIDMDQFRKHPPSPLTYGKCVVLN
jgi:hypothetical protein